MSAQPAATPPLPGWATDSTPLCDQRMLAMEITSTLQSCFEQEPDQQTYETCMKIVCGKLVAIKEIQERKPCPIPTR
tara:strand:- start:606 stop:836 length:231 start_codon:yes stop_codon:yes gene_type:complete